jgi:hypothetical protein
VSKFIKKFLDNYRQGKSGKKTAAAIAMDNASSATSTMNLSYTMKNG